MNKKLAEAKAFGIDVDPNLEKEINEHSARLISERNLRFEMENMYVSGSTKDTVDHLQELISIASDNKVEESYLSKANDLAEKMTSNILARETYEMMHTYPERIYPEADPVDPKTGKPLKVKEDKKKPKKRKKKEPPFPTPEWAATIEDVEKKFKLLKELVGRAEELHLEAEFLANVDEELKRFTKEIKYRKDKYQEELEEAEAKLAAKKKKKK